MGDTNAYTPKLPYVAKWFRSRRLPYTERIDTWLHDNAYDTVERLKLVDDLEWRKLLLPGGGGDDSYKIGDFKTFKHSIKTLRNIEFDELHDWTMDNLPELPLAIFGKIGKFLPTGKRGRRIPIITYGAEEKQFTTVYDLPGDIINLCIAGGKAVADVVRFAYLHTNETYLRKAILSHSKRNMKILSWMGANPDWKLLCSRCTKRSRADFRRLSISAEGLPYFGIHETSSGSLCYREYVDREKRVLSKEVDGMLFINNKKVNGMDEEVAWKIFQYEFWDERVDITFLKNAYSLFSDPVTAISLFLTSVLQNMIERKYINPNDTFQYQWDPSDSEYAIKMPLLYHALRHSPNSWCFEYLMSLPDIDCGVEFTTRDGEKTNMLFCCLAPKYCSQLSMILGHPTAPDVDCLNANGLTALQIVCQVDDEGLPAYEDGYEKLLRILLENGADPLIKNTDDLPHPIEHMYRCKKEDDYLGLLSDDERSTLAEMTWLLEKYGEGGRRDSDQPPITDFFGKRRRLY